MTVSSSTSSARFPGNGSTTVFPLPFRFFSNGDITARLIDDVTGSETALSLGINYTLFGAGEPEEDGNPVSTLTMFVPPPVGSSLFVQRFMEVTQPTDIINQSRFFPETHETVFDRITMLIQQVFGRISHALLVPDSDPIPARLPSAQIRAGQLLGFDSSGDPIVVGPTSGSAADLAIRLANQVDPTLGLHLIGYKGRTADVALAQLGVSPFDKGAKGDFVTDDTDAVMAAFNEAKSLRRALLLNGDFAVTHLDFNAMSGVTILCSGTLTGISLAAQESVLTIRNSADVTMVGKLSISAGYRSNYESGAAIYSDSATGCSKMWISGVSFAGCKRTWDIGRTTEPDKLISEITIEGGFSYGCPSGVRVTGTQTVINFLAPQILTGIEGGSGAWLTLPRIAIQCIGALVIVTGGEVLMTDIATWLLVDIQPVGGSAIGNQYGSVILNGSAVETASQLAQFRNPNSIGSLIANRGTLVVDKCSGFHSTGPFAFIQAAADHSGAIILGANRINASVARTTPNVQASGSTEIFQQGNSFGENFTNRLSAYSGGILRFPAQQIFEATSLGAASAPSGLSDMIFKTVPVRANNIRFSTQYNTTTGVFTVPSGGLKDVVITVAANVKSNLFNGSFNVLVDGSIIGKIGTASSLSTGTVPLGDLSPGSVVGIQFSNSSGSFTWDASSLDRLVIHASS